jgi:hypothetical protein
MGAALLAMRPFVAGEMHVCSCSRSLMVVTAMRP